METSEKVKIPVADFCSKLGGILNLWSGITVILFLELMEVLIRICHKSLWQRNMTEVQPDPVVEASEEKVGLPEKQQGFSFKEGEIMTRSKTMHHQNLQVEEM